MSKSLAERGVEILNSKPPATKVRLTEEAVLAWAEGKLRPGTARAPQNPARPAKPELVAPRDVARRTRGRKGRIALLHAVAHIELNAIDLAWDMIVRFSHLDMTDEFYSDWLKVAGEEALHFTLLQGRLADYDTHYGDLPAHNGLWEAAHDTADDILARLAIVPLVLEARGLDITPSMITRFEKEDDPATADVLKRILQDEIGHVHIGQKWFERVAQSRGLEPVEAFRSLVKARFRGQIKPPFNFTNRDDAGMPRAYYDGLE